MSAWYANGTNKHDFSNYMVILVESSETKQGSSGMSEKGVGTAKEHKFRDTGHEWVLLFLKQCSEEVRSKLLFMWWRSCHIRKKTIFAMGNIM
jgi:hypothetical protein